MDFDGLNLTMKKWNILIMSLIEFVEKCICVLKKEFLKMMENIKR